MKSHILLESRKAELLILFQNTPYWQKLPLEKKQKVIELLMWANKTIQSREGVFWIGRIFQRAFVYFSRDQPGDDTYKKKQLFLKTKGYTLARAHDELTFFTGSKQNQGQFRPVFDNLRQLSTTNRRVLNGINSIQYTDNNKNDLNVHDVYSQLNSVLSSMDNIEKLPQGTPIIKFEDGSQWVALDIGYCEEEGAMLHHCGNVAGKTNLKERIWSYRLPSEAYIGYFVPKLSFVYNTDTKSLGEMKGFANEKPNPKYHKYIVSLLSKPDRVSYLAGSGYLPAHNFSLNDLSDELFTKLYELNPDLVKTQLTKGDSFQKLSKEKKELLDKLQS